MQVIGTLHNVCKHIEWRYVTFIIQHLIFMWCRYILQCVNFIFSLLHNLLQLSLHVWTDIFHTKKYIFSISLCITQSVINYQLLFSYHWCKLWRFNLFCGHGLVKEYLCHKWSRICPVCRNHKPVLSSVMMYHQVCIVTRRVPLVEQELATLPKHPSSHRFSVEFV